MGRLLTPYSIWYPISKSNINFVETEAKRVYYELENNCNNEKDEEKVLAETVMRIESD